MEKQKTEKTEKKKSPNKEPNTNVLTAKADDMIVKKSIEERVIESKNRKGLHGRTKTADSGNNRSKTVMMEHAASGNAKPPSAQVNSNEKEKLKNLTGSHASGSKAPRVQLLDLSKVRTNDPNLLGSDSACAKPARFTSSDSSNSKSDDPSSIKAVVTSVTEAVNVFLTADTSTFVMLAKKLLVLVNRLCTLLNEEQYGSLPENFRKLVSQLIDERKEITKKERKEDAEVVKMIHDSIIEYLKSILEIDSGEEDKAVKHQRMKQQRAFQKKLLELVKLIMKSLEKKEDSKFRNYQMQLVETNKDLYNSLTDKDQISSLKSTFHSFLQIISTVFEQKSPTEETLEMLEQEKIKYTNALNVIGVNLLLDESEYRVIISNYRNWVAQMEAHTKLAEDSTSPAVWKNLYLLQEQNYYALKLYAAEMLAELNVSCGVQQWLTKKKLKFSILAQGTLPPVVIEGGMFEIEKEVNGFSGEYQINFVDDIFRKEMFGFEFKSYLATTTDTSAQKYICCILKQPARAGYHGLFITKRGYTQFNIPLAVSPNGFSKWLATEFPSSVFQKMSPTPEVTDMILQIEMKNNQIKNDIKIAVINAGDKKNPHEMFQNPSDPAFEQFLTTMKIDVNDKNANRNKLWNHVNITYFVATQLNKDEHRRDVGNAPSFIFFKNSEEPFSASEIGSIGMVPQIFIVVQPYKNDQSLYRVGSFRSGNMRPFDPPIPENYIFTASEVRNFILTKIHNGNVNFYYSPPMNRMFVQKRTEAIDAIHEKAKKDKLVK